MASKHHGSAGKKTWISSRLYSMPPMASAANVVHMEVDLSVNGVIRRTRRSDVAIRILISGII